MTISQKRRHPRQLRRVQVRFETEGEGRVRHGFTKNLSLSGALITGNDLPGRGSTLRIELVGKGLTRVVYARVVHAHRVPPELRRFAESAMGVRFLRQEELIGPFLDGGGVPGKEPSRSEVRPEEPLGSGRWPISGGRFGKEEGAAGDGGPDAGGGEAKQGGRAAGTSAGPGRDGGAASTAAATARPTPGSGPRPVGSQRAFSLTYETPKTFLTAYRRDLVNGGLFVATTEPARLYDTVTVELHLPPPVRQVFRFEARVVQTVEPRQLPGGETGGGVGLEVLDTDRVLKELRPVVDLLS